MTFNPNANETLGLEWFVDSESYAVIDAAAKSATAKITARSTETIDQLIMPHVVSGPASGYLRQWVDVYSLSDVDPVAPAVTELTFVPLATKTSSNVTKSDFFTTSGLHNEIDEPDDDPAPESLNYIVNANYGGTATARFTFDTASIPNSWRIVYIKFEVRAKGFDWSWQKPKIEFNWWNNNTDLGRFATINPEPDYVFRTRVLGPYYFDFFNEGRWLQPEIVNLANSSSRHIGVKFFYASAISRLTLKVGVVPETRTAVGVSSRVNVLPSGIQSNSPMMFKTPLNVDNFAKTNGKEYLFVVTRCDDPFGASPTLSPAYLKLDSGTENPHAEAQAYTPTLTGLDGLISAVGSASTSAHALVLGTSGGAQSSDSQPYFDLDFVPVSSDEAGLGPAQNFIAAAGITYSRIKAVVAVDASAMPTTDLLFTVYRSADNVAMGGPATLTVADLSNPTIATQLGTLGSLTLYEVSVTMSAGTTLTAAQYHIWTQSLTTGARPWYLGLLDAGMSHALTGNVTHGGTYGAYYDGTTYANKDLMITLGSVPTNLTNFSATVSTFDLPNNGSTCDPGTAQEVTLNWASSTLGGSFSRYELERSNDAGASWHRIANITDEDDSGYIDQEADRDVPEIYRVRVRRTDGAVSDWVQSGSVTLTSSPGVVLMVSNADPDLACGFVVLGSTQDYEFLDAEESVYVRMHRRNFQVRFRPLEERGVRWTFRVLIYVVDETAVNPAPPAGKGIRAFDTLRDVGLAVVPYVCLITPWGERLFGSVEITSGTHAEPAQYYVATVTFTQGADEPSVVTV